MNCHDNVHLIYVEADFSICCLISLSSVLYYAVLYYAVRRTDDYLNVIVPRATLSEQGLDRCCHLEELSLENNSIAVLEGMLHLGRLTRLHLARNYIGTIGAAAVSRMPALQYLDLESNQLSSLTGLEVALALTELYVGNNDIGSGRNVFLLKVRARRRPVGVDRRSPRPCSSLYIACRITLLFRLSVILTFVSLYRVQNYIVQAVCNSDIWRKSNTRSDWSGTWLNCYSVTMLYSFCMPVLLMYLFF